MTDTQITAPARRAVWRYVGGLAPVILLWAALAGWLASALAERARYSDEADEATIVEWINETRTFRQTLPELVRECASLPKEQNKRKWEEIAAQIEALLEPTQMFPNQLPGFPEIYSISISLGGQFMYIPRAVPPPESARTARIPVPDSDASIAVVYRMHAFNRLKQREQDRRQTFIIAGVLLVTATVLALLFVTRFLRREHSREVERLTALAEGEHRENELATAKARAVEAEKAALEVKSQIHASIGIMAGSYAHNIKNLLVRPNDLLARCQEQLPPRESGMIEEVRSTLGTVTERLQQILRTVRRDPQQTHTERLDLNDLVSETVAAWHDTALDKWKLQIDSDVSGAPVLILGDSSHLQQALENLLFNARDATFEMRNKLRDEARASDDRKTLLLAAAGWKGHATLAARNTEQGPLLEIRDNGIGMTADVKANCLAAHFTTKRDNALYEGYTAGMGLGLSFVAMVLTQHGAKLEIESEPGRGAVFRILFPKPDSAV